MYSYNGKNTQSTENTYDSPFEKQQGGQQRPAFSAPFRQGQRPGFLVRTQNEHARPSVPFDAPLRTYQNDHGPNKMRRLDSAQQAHTNLQQQASVRFIDLPQITTHQHAQARVEPQRQSLQYSNAAHIQEEEHPMSQESVNTLTQACLAAPLSEDEAQLLTSKSANDDNEPPRIIRASDLPSTNLRPFSRGYLPSQTSSKQATAPPSSTLTSSSQPSASPVPTAKTDLERKVDAIFECLRIKAHNIIRDVFAEAHADVQAELKRSSSESSNSKQA